MWCLPGLLTPQALGLLVFISCSHMTYSFPFDGVKGQGIQEVPYSSSNAGSRGVTSAPFNNDTGATAGAAGEGGIQGIGVSGQSLDSVINSTTESTSEAPVSLGLTSASSSLQESATLSNGSALSAPSEAPPLAAGGSQDTVNYDGNSGQASAAAPVAERTPPPLDTAANGGNPGSSDAGADTKVSSDGAANNSSDDSEDEEVIVVIESNNYGDGDNNGTDVTGSDGDPVYDSGTFMKGSSDSGADPKVSSKGAANNGSDDSEDELVIVVIESNNYGDGDNNGTDVTGSDGDHDDDSGTFMKGSSDTGADIKVSSDGAASNGSDDNEDEKVIVVIESNNYGDGGNNGTDVTGSDGDHDDDSGTFMKGPGDSSGVKGNQNAPVKA